MDDAQSLSHSKWKLEISYCVCTEIQKAKVIYGKLKAEIGKILRDLCERKGAELLEVEACTDHIHVVTSILPGMSVADFVGYLKKCIADV